MPTHLPVKGEGSLPHGALEGYEKLIIETLREKKISGFNELCWEFPRGPSRPTVRKTLENLVKAQLVYKKEAERRGQKHQYMLTEVLVSFENKEKRLASLWDELFDDLKCLENLVMNGKLGYQDAGSLLAWLIFEAVPLLASPLVGVPSLPLELEDRLLSFSAETFRSYFEEILRLGRSHPKMREGFQKGCKELRRYVKPITEMIDETLQI